jgi:hypothetical protein
MNKICPICLMKISKTGKVILDCNHGLHLKCYIECIKHNIIKCPLCQKHIKQNKSYLLFLNDKFTNVMENLQNTLSLESILKKLDIVTDN